MVCAGLKYQVRLCHGPDINKLTQGVETLRGDAQLTGPHGPTLAERQEVRIVRERVGRMFCAAGSGSTMLKARVDDGPLVCCAGAGAVLERRAHRASGGCGDDDSERDVISALELNCEGRS